MLKSIVTFNMNQLEDYNSALLFKSSP